jgi:hypothetical protein
MVKAAEPKIVSLGETHGYRLINSKFPPIDIFEQVISAEDFELAFLLQSLTNPRLKAEVGNLNLLPMDEIPWGIRGCSYAIGAFTHVNAQGSRFSDGSYGVLYIANDADTAIAEVSYHHNNYFSNVSGFKFERFVFRLLACQFSAPSCADITHISLDNPLYSPSSYSASQSLARELKNNHVEAIQYRSVRHTPGLCWGLFTPQHILDVLQSAHYEMVWDGQRISATAKLSK